MTAYVHIGTEKTGTTSIQTFLNKNREYLQKSNYYFLKSIGNNHWDCAFLGYNFGKIDGYILSRKLADIANFKNHKRNIFNKLINEVNAIGNNEANIILSSELFQSRLENFKEIKRLKRILNLFGFSKIFIVVYVREQGDMVGSLYSEALKWNETDSIYMKEVGNMIYPKGYKKNKDHFLHICNHRQTLENWGKAFGKENLIVRLFNKNEFKNGDLLKDFVDAIGIEWNDSFIVPENQNESYDLIGIELLQLINKKWQDIQSQVRLLLKNNFSSKDKELKFMPPKEVYQSYIDYFEESNEWVRKEFFPHKERLFPKKDLSNYKENYELKEMKPEYWDRIAEFIADIVKTKNQTIADKTTIIQNKDKLITQKDQIIQTKNQELESKTKEFTQTKNQLDFTKKELDSKVKQMHSQIKILESSQNQSDLKIQKLTEANQQLDLKNQELTLKNQQLNSKTKELNFTLRYGTAKDRIHNHLSYKLGQAMIVNSKNIFNIIFMPVYITLTLLSYKQEQKIYQEKIKKNPNLKLPILESYPDYKESLKEKECLTYKLGEAFIKANKTWYKGGYVRLWFEVRKLRGEGK